MTTSNRFSDFCRNLKMSDNVVSDVQSRYKRITRQLNSDFWDDSSETKNSLYAGSYGRGTAIHVSDIDILFKLPIPLYNRFNLNIGNSQSNLLQSVKNSLCRTYSTSHIKADGQVIQLNFNDGISFEIVPVFNKDGNSFLFPDTNNGGSWRTTKPMAEISRINEINNSCNKNLKRLCRMVRAWKESNNVKIGGLLIDTLAHNFLIQWDYRKHSYSHYGWMTRDFFLYLSERNNQKFWFAPGSSQQVYSNHQFQYKALQAYKISNIAIEYENKSQQYMANLKWREIYGTRFPN